MNQSVNKFCYKYEATCRPASQHWRRPVKVPIKFGDDPTEVLYQQIPYYSVPMVDITLPEDRFRALIEHDEFLDKFNHLKDSTTGSIFYDQMNQVRAIMNDHEEECRIRNQHPSVQAAYQHYLTLLNLCR